jgi:hypothetical protein
LISVNAPSHLLRSSVANPLTVQSHELPFGSRVSDSLVPIARNSLLDSIRYSDSLAIFRRRLETNLTKYVHIHNLYPNSSAFVSICLLIFCVLNKLNYLLTYSSNSCELISINVSMSTDYIKISTGLLQSLQRYSTFNCFHFIRPYLYTFYATIPGILYYYSQLGLQNSLS